MDEDKTNTATIDEDKEWADALDEFSGGAVKDDKAVEDKKDGSNTDDKATGDDKKVEDNSAVDAAGDKSVGDDVSTKDADGKSDTKVEDVASAEDALTPKTVRETRAIQREYAAEEKAMRDDIRKELFDGVTNTIYDADGDPVRTIEDVMKLTNPVTKTTELPEGRPFTQDEAAAWLLQAQQYKNQTVATVEKQIEEIADTNLSLKDQVENIREKYGEFLKTHPDIRDEIWAEYKETMTTDAKTGYITKAPVNMERFYDVSLKGHIQTETQLADKTAAEQAAEKAKEETKKVQTRTDREDIFSAGKSDTGSKEDNEWSKAADAYYNNK